MTLKVRKDPHIVEQFKLLAPPSLPANTGFIAHPAIEENLARYLKTDGALARAYILFNEIVKHCDTKSFEISYPLMGQRLEPTEGAGTYNTMVPRQIGEIVLQVLRLPPLPGIPQAELPQSLNECQQGLRHVNWHKATYHEGVLTQLGGDCLVRDSTSSARSH